MTATTSLGPAALVDALMDVLDPDLGLNIVDFGFVRSITVTDDQVAVLEMTLTSPTCPLTKVIEDQIRTALVGSGLVRDFRVDWVWSPPWTPAALTESGREQLAAIGFVL